jgi:hypothetical protein
MITRYAQSLSLRDIRSMLEPEADLMVLMLTDESGFFRYLFPQLYRPVFVSQTPHTIVANPDYSSHPD